MQAGTLIASDVMSFTSRVLVNGIQRPALSWSVDRGLVGDLPEQVVAGGGISHATGNIVWAAGRDVETGALNPWNPSTGWIPSEGDTVQIFAGDGTTEWSQFVGVIDSSDGGIGDGFQSKVVDRIDDLSRKVDLPALIDVMPPIDASGPYRRFRLSPRFYVMAALRAAGFHAVPAKEFGCTLDVPAYGSMWALVGLGTLCAQGTEPSQAPIWPEGSFVADVSAAYTPSLARSANVPIQLTLQVGENHSGMARIRAVFGDGKSFELRVAGSVVSGRVNDVDVASATVEAPCIVQALYKNGVIRVRSSSGADVSLSAQLNSTSNLSRIDISVDTTGRANGFQVSHPTEARHEFASLAFTPTANVETGAMHDAIIAGRATGARSARELLDEIGSALLWPYWIDETGVMQAIQSDVLRGRASSQTVTTKDDIRELSWSRDLLGARSEIITSYDISVVNRRSDYSIGVWSPSESVVLQSGDEHTVVVEPPAGEEWIMVDDAANGIQPKTNQGVGTLVGAIYTDGATEEWANVSGTQITISMAMIAQGKWTIKHVASTLAGGKQVELRTVSEGFGGSTVLFPYWWGKELPIVRAKGTVDTKSITRAPSVAGSVGPVLEHDCGPWATGHLPENETRVVDAVTQFITEQVVAPQPVITGLRVGFDPRRQLGDVITISSPSFMGVILRCLITSINNSAGAYYAQELSVRIIDASTSFTTYAEFEKAWGPTADYNALATAWGALATYADFNQDPLRGTN